MPSIDRILQVLPIAQRLAIKELMARKKRLGSILSARDEIREAQSLSDAIGGTLGGQVFSPTKASFGERISSEKHNLNMERIFIDMMALYSQLQSIEKADALRATSLQSEYLKSRAVIQKLLNDARTYSLRKKYITYTEVQVIDFNSARNVSVTRPRAVIDPKTRLLELAVIGDTKTHLSNRGSRETRVYTKTISHGIKGTVSSLPPEGMVDQKPETFWSTIILTDSEVSQIYEGKEVDGPVVEVYLKFSHAEHLNVLRLLPFGVFPTRLVDISYRPSKNSEIFIPIEEFAEETSSDWIEVNFKPIFATEVKVVIAQENFKSVNYHLPRRLVVNTDLFDQVINSRLKKIAGNLSVDSDLADELKKSLSAYDEALEDLAETFPLVELEKNTVSEVKLVDDIIALIGIVLGELDPERAKALINETLLGSTKTDIVHIQKFEYLVGVREVETSYELYAPTCNYSSERYLPQATLSEVRIEVDKIDIPVQTSWGTYYPTSTEWNIDIGEGREVPIHPANFTGDGGIPVSLDERLVFDRVSNIAYTRLGSRFDNPLAVRRNGVPLPLTGYTTYREFDQSIPRLRITLKKTHWDENSVYTVDYDVSNSSIDIDVLNLFDPQKLSTPELHKDLKEDNDLVLTKYPFIDYEPINRTGLFDKDENTSLWTYKPPIPNTNTGQVRVWPHIVDSVGNTISSGFYSGLTVSGDWGAQSGVTAFLVSTLPTGSYFTEPHSWYLKLQDMPAAHRLSGFFGTSGMWFVDQPKISLAQLRALPSGALTGMSGVTGSTPSGYIETEYALGVGANLQHEVFVFDNATYTPLKVTIGGREATNITDYATLEHPAFSISKEQDQEYQYIHAGNRLYFNQPASKQEIKVDYSWVSEFIIVKGVLRCNKPINPDLTPKVDEIRILMNTSIL